MSDPRGDAPITRQAKRAAERRALDHAAAPGGLPDSMAPAEFGALRAELRRRLGRRGAGSAPAVAASAAEAFDQRAAPQLKRHPIQCRRGCAFCCHGQQVPVAAPEALAIAAFIRARPPAKQDAMAARLTATDQATRDQPRTEVVRQMRPCPFLEEGACGIYPVRPLACRAFVSLDVEACKRGFAGAEVEIPTPALFMRLEDFARRATREAAAKVGLDTGWLELHAAVAIALADAAAETRWLAGEPVFAAAAGHPTMGRGGQRRP